MSHENRNAGAILLSSSAAAHNHSTSGISKPAVQPLQRKSIEKNKDEEPLQMANGHTPFPQPGESKNDENIQAGIKPFQLKSNNTGLPDNLKSGVENLSGYSMDDVNVHYNSGKPSQLQAHAFAQGTDIHLAPGQEKHLPHEAWHVVQQKQGRVAPTMQLKGKVNINNDSALEKEADDMGQKAAQLSKDPATVSNKEFRQQVPAVPTTQLMLINGVDVTESSKVDDLKQAIGWSVNYGITKPLKENEKVELLRLIRLLKSNDSSLGNIVEDLERESSEEEEDGKDEGFGEGFGDEDFGGSQSLSLHQVVSQQPKRRQTPEEFGWEKFPDTYKGLKKIGVHETDFANLEGLVTNGPAVEKVDSANHIGKGRGFYVTPVGKKKLATVVGDIVYGDSFVAIYIKSNIGPVRSPDETSNHTAILDKEHGDKLCYYVMSGGGEIVIPERCFPFVKAVSVREQLNQIREEKKKKTKKKEKEAAVEEDYSHEENEVAFNQDHQLALAIYDEEVSFVERLNKLSDDYNNAKSENVKKRIKQRWMFLETRLFNRWSMDGRRYTLWLDVRPIGTHTAFPPRP
jgi:Domain of unknown function (DUF4157)